MARVNFTAIVSEIFGKLAGSVFQNSYGGFQIRTRVTPSNPQSDWQQYRRNYYGFIRATWRDLTNAERQSFIDGAASPGEGFNFYTGNNINLLLVNEAMISLYVATALPDNFEFQISAADPTQLMIKGTGAITTVPTGMKLLIYSTRERQPTHLFTNESDYSPIKIFDEGTDLSADVNVITDYNSRFGNLQAEKYLAMKSVIIKKSNGLRSAEFLTNTTTEEMPSKYIPLAVFPTETQTIGTSPEVLNPYTMPGNTLQADGYRLLIKAAIQKLAAASSTFGLSIAGNPVGTFTTSIANTFNFEFQVMRIDSDSIRVVTNIFDPVAGYQLQQTQLNALNFTSSIEVGIYADSGAATDIHVRTSSVDLIENPD